MGTLNVSIFPIPTLKQLLNKFWRVFVILCHLCRILGITHLSTKSNAMHLLKLHSNTTFMSQISFIRNIPMFYVQEFVYLGSKKART